MNLLGNIGTTELIVIFLLALIVVGPEKLPELGRRVGAFVRDARRVFANLSKDLGPELTSLPQAIQDVRDTAQAFKSLPRDAIRTLSQAAIADADGEPSAAAPASASPASLAGDADPSAGDEVPGPLPEAEAIPLAPPPAAGPAESERSPEQPGGPPVPARQPGEGAAEKLLV